MAFLAMVFDNVLGGGGGWWLDLCVIIYQERYRRFVNCLLLLLDDV